MLFLTTLLIAFLIGDAGGCSPQQQTHCVCEVDLDTTVRCILTYAEPGYKCKCLVNRHYHFSDDDHCEESSHLIQNCDCDEANAWTQGSYTIDKVDYDTDQYDLQSDGTIVLATKYIPNCAGHVQTITFTATQSITRTSSFSRTSGVSIQKGRTFTAGIPNIVQIGISSSRTLLREHKFGEKKTTEEKFSESFTCNGSPHKTTECKVVMQKGNLNVPYTMTLKHKRIPNCFCESKGIWTGVQAYNASLTAREIGLCTMPYTSSSCTTAPVFYTLVSVIIYPTLFY